MANYFPELPKSTYSMCYQYSRPHHFKAMYREIPSVVDQPTIVQPPRDFPIEPYYPNRVNRIAQAPAAGLGSKGILRRYFTLGYFFRVFILSNANTAFCVTYLIYINQAINIRAFLLKPSWCRACMCK